MRRRDPAVLPDAPRPLLFAHRGNCRSAPENTLAAFRSAREGGLPGIELDVQQCATGEIVVVHDFDLARTTGHRGAVADTPFSVIRPLDAGSWFAPGFAGEPIPLLSDLFLRLGDSVYYDIELKSRDRRCDDLVVAVARLVEEFGLTRRSLISSFNPHALRAVGRLAPYLPTALIYSDDTEVPPFARHGEARLLAHCQALKPSHRQIHAPGLWLNRTIFGYAVIAWTVDDPLRAKELFRLGVDGLISNAAAGLLGLSSAAATAPGIGP